MRIVRVSAVEAELRGRAGVALGVGPVASALGAAELLAGDVDGVVFVGTAGAYPGGPAVGAVVRPARVGLSQGLAEVGAGYAPLAPEPLDVAPWGRDVAGVVRADVLAVEAITTDAAVVAARGAAWAVEHMEVFSAAWAAHRRGVPFAAFLGIANVVGPEAHEQWLAHRDRAEEAAGAAADRFVEDLLRG